MFEELFELELSNFIDCNKRLNKFPRKWSPRVLSLIYLASKFEFAREYTEKEINAVIDDWHTFNDSALIRRLLYEGGFIDRSKNGSKYWLVNPQPKYEEFQPWITGSN